MTAILLTLPVLVLMLIFGKAMLATRPVTTSEKLRRKGYWVW